MFKPYWNRMVYLFNIISNRMYMLLCSIMYKYVTLSIQFKYLFASFPCLLHIIRTKLQRMRSASIDAFRFRNGGSHKDVTSAVLCHILTSCQNNTPSLRLLPELQVEMEEMPLTVRHQQQSWWWDSHSTVPLPAVPPLCFLLPNTDTHMLIS